MGEQAQRHKKIEDNPHEQNRERDQRGEDHDVWRIEGGIGHGVIRRAWTISVRGTSTTPAPKSIWFKSFGFERGNRPQDTGRGTGQNVAKIKALWAGFMPRRGYGDSARGFNPRNPPINGSALKGRNGEKGTGQISGSS